MKRTKLVDTSDEVQAGFCRGCKRKIPHERLRVVPNTKFCVKCAAENELTNETPFVVLDEYDPLELSSLLSPDD